MIAITDASAYSNLDYVETNNVIVIPTQTEIQTLIGPSDFINTAITTAFKALLVKISNETYTVGTGFFLKPQELVVEISHMFNTIGFYHNNGIINFQINTDAFDIGTAMIINDLNLYNKNTEFEKIAYDAFHVSDNSWAKEANDIRAMANSGLQKLHYITVYSNSNSNSNFNFLSVINNYTNILNRRNENTERFLMINLKPNGDPVMPRLGVKNNSNEKVRVRLKVYYEKTVKADGTGQIKRRFLDYFPKTGDPMPPFPNNHSIIINPNEFKDITYGGEIRGGDGIIEYIPESLNWNIDWETNNNSLFKFKFYIRGENPNRNQVSAYLDEEQIPGNSNSSYSTRYWFLMRLIRHESGTRASNEFRQFNPKGNGYFVNNNKTGLPNLGAPKGYGLGQIDNSGTLTIQQIQNLGLTSKLAEIQPGAIKQYQTIIDNTGRTIDYERQLVASDQEVWNWKKNIDAAIKVIEGKFSMVINNITDPNDSSIIWEYGISSMRTFIQNWNTANPSNTVSFPVNQAEGPITYGAIRSSIQEFDNFNDLFPATPVETNTLKSFYDAMLIKAYNGLGANINHYLHLTPIPQGSGTKPSLNIKNVENGVHYVREISREND